MSTANIPKLEESKQRGVILSSLAKITRVLPGLKFSSTDYWADRYRIGWNSGAGSYGELAEFKAEVLNAFVAKNMIRSVVEFGCGDGNQLSLMKYPRYTGLDVAPGAIELCRNRFSSDDTKHFALLKPTAMLKETYKADLALSMDVLFHLIEDSVFHSYMRRLFDSADRFVVIYSDNNDARPQSVSHVRHRNFTNWIDANRPDWRLIEHVPNRYPFDETSESGSWSEFWIYTRA